MNIVRDKSEALTAWRRTLLRSTALTGAVACLSFGFVGVASAQDECGSPNSATVTCTSAGNPYPDGVTYTPTSDLTVVIDSDVTVDDTVSVSGPPAIAIENGGSIATSNAGAPGISAYSANNGVSITNTGSITTLGDNSPGISANGATGVTISGTGSISTAGNGSPGISVSTPASATGSVSVTAGSVTTTGPNSAGVYVSTYGGPVMVNVGTVKTTGDFSPGVFVGATGSVTIDVGQVSTAGASTLDGQIGPNDSLGIFAISTGGDISITAGSVSTATDLSRGIFAYTPTGMITINSGTITTSGLAAIGIQAISSGTGVDITSGSISTRGYEAPGIVSYGSAPISIASTGNLTTQGGLADGIYAETSAGVSITNSGAISTQGATSRGIYASGGTGVTITGAGSISTAGATSPAIVAASYGGAVSVQAGPITTIGASSDGVDANAIDAVNISTAGVHTLGAGSNGVAATSTSDTVAVIVGGAILSNGGDAVDVTAAKGSTVTIAAHGSLQSLTGYAVQSFSGPVAIDNAGLIAGRIRLIGSGNTFNNTGMLVATGDSDFGAGGDVFNNSGSVQVGAVGGPAEAVTFAGLQTFNNTGLVDLRNGHAGDVLNLAGAFNGESGSRVGLDVQLGAAGSTADKLVVGSISGNTSLSIQDVSAGPGALNKGIVVVQAPVGSPAGAATLASGPISKGFVQYSLAYDSAKGAYSLVGLPGAPAYQTATFVEGAENNWHESEAAWSSHLTGLRDAAFAGDASALAPGGRGWAEVFGSDLQRRDAQNFTTFGQAQRFDLSYDQSDVGVQAGFDVLQPALGGVFAYGLTGGYSSASLRFKAMAGSVDYDVGDIGLYAAYVTGPAFVNVLFKYDIDQLSASNPVAGYRAEPNSDAYGGAVEVGYRLGTPRLWLEPVTSLQYVSANLDSFAAQGASFDFDDADSLLGKIGFRVGGAFHLANGVVLSPYAGGHYVKEFDGGDQVAFVSGGYTVNFTNRRPGGYGQAEGGVNVFTPGPLSGFVEADGDFGGGESGGGGRAGIRIRW